MTDKRIGILGGGQLGKMLCMAGYQMSMNMSILDSALSFPAAQVCKSFKEGEITNYDDVFSFGQYMDIITIEIEKVNVQALIDLEKIGKSVFPSSDIILTIQDKGIQKQFFEANNLPTSDFKLVTGKEELLRLIKSGDIQQPFVQKVRKNGYDGRGVKIIKSSDGPDEMIDAPSVIEKLVNVDKEIAVIICRNAKGDIAIYDPVEMVFDPKANLLVYQLSPSSIEEKTLMEINHIAYDIALRFDLVGILAIELFLTHSGEILINEMAPRPHNSGHHSIEACKTSQYENHLRSICNLPLGDPTSLSPSLLINLLGSSGYNGPTHYRGIEQILNIQGSNLHLYGKKISKPNRKMGHVTILYDGVESPLKYFDIVKESFYTSPL